MIGGRGGVGRCSGGDGGTGVCGSGGGGGGGGTGVGLAGLVVDGSGGSRTLAVNLVTLVVALFAGFVFTKVQ